MLGAVEDYAHAEGGAYLEHPAHADIPTLIQDLDQASNTFVVIYPSDDTRDWFISVAPRTGALGGYQIERHDRDPDQEHPTKNAAAVPADIATDVVDWISQR